MAKNISLYRPNIPVTRNMYGVQISGFMPEELEQIKDAASQKASKEKAITEKKRKELEQKKAEEDRIRKANDAWVKNIKDKIAKAKSLGVDTSELEQQLSEYIIETKGPIIEPIVQQESVNIATPEESNNNNISVAPQSKRAESVTTEDPYHSDTVEAIADSKEEPQRAKPLINPYGQNVPLQGPKGILNQSQYRREGAENLPQLSSGTAGLLDEGKIYAGKQGRAYVESDIQKGLRTSNAALMGRGYNHPYEPIEITKGGGYHTMMDVNSVSVWPIEKPVQKEREYIPGVMADTYPSAKSNIASLETMEQVANMRGKVLSQELEDKESTTKNRATTENVDSLTKATKGANAINAVNAAVGLGLGIYGAHQINKMQRPSMVSAPQIEAAKIRDTGAQMMTARKGMIEQSANTSREALRRAGRSDLNATITAGETRALNEAAGSIEGMRANINAANVAAENRVREINATTKMQADQFNSQLQASFNQFRSQLGSQNLSTTVQNISANLGGIAQNNYAKALRERDEAIQRYQAKVLARVN